MWPFATAALNTYEAGPSSDYGIILENQDDTMLSRVFTYGRALNIKLINFWGSVSTISADTVGCTLYINGIKPSGIQVDKVDIFGSSNVSGIAGAIQVVGTSAVSNSLQMRGISYVNGASATYNPLRVVYINDTNSNVLIDGITPKSLDSTVYINAASTVVVDNLIAENYCQDPAAFQCVGALIQNESTTAKLFIGKIGSGLNVVGSPSAVSYYDGYIDNTVFEVAKPSLIPLYPELIYSSGTNFTMADSLGRKSAEVQQVWGAGAVGDYVGLRVNPVGATYTEPGTHMFGVTYQTTTAFTTAANDTRILDIPITAGDVDQYITFPEASRALSSARRRYIRSLSYTGGLLTAPTAYGRLYQGKIKFFDMYLCKSNVACAGFDNKPMQYSAIPVWGIYRIGEYIVNSNPVVGQPKGWRCTVAGTPGTWVSEGNL
jgi:hypothetical protein